MISIGRKGFSEFKLDKLLDTLSNDDSAEVRRKLAAGFHEVKRNVKTLFHSNASF